ncbi:MAG: antitoxin Xre/MbcA/ParS toxin-binding domain-containing protein [Xanthobacteraceae bacterium]
MRGFENIAGVLGLPPNDKVAASPLNLVAKIERGLPFKVVDRVACLLAPDDTHFKYVLIPKPTYDRRKGGKLSPDQGTRMARIARVWALAVDVWKSDADARNFLFRPHAMIENKRPFDVALQSEFGAELVLDILGRLKYGTAA